MFKRLTLVGVLAVIAVVAAHAAPPINPTPPPAVEPFFSAVADNDSAQLVAADRAAEAAERDSFPLTVVLDSLGRSQIRVALSPDTTEFTACAVARNRYTGRVMIMVPWDIGKAEADRIARTCEPTRQSYAARRSG